MGLWSLPDVLIIHLKRFRQTNNASNKLSTMVEFPLERCDMSPFVTKGGNGNDTSTSAVVHNNKNSEPSTNNQVTTVAVSYTHLTMTTTPYV